MAIENKEELRRELFQMGYRLDGFRVLTPDGCPVAHFELGAWHSSALGSFGHWELLVRALQRVRREKTDQAVDAAWEKNRWL